MLRISRLTDYGTLILVHLANHPGRVCSASDIAEGTRVALPTTQKILKVLARSGLVISARGTDGGYALGRAAADISAADILDVLEGPVAITECSGTDSHCELEPLCQVGGAWQKINKAIRGALADISLANLVRPPRELSLPALTHGMNRSSGRSERG
jgi:FeS assembly SUF system regulator